MRAEEIRLKKIDRSAARKKRLVAKGLCANCGLPRGVTLYKTRCFKCGSRPRNHSKDRYTEEGAS